jgi:serpin B
MQMQNAYRWLWVCVLIGCGRGPQEGTHTGNPGPSGADFVRSDLKRDDHPNASDAERAQLGSDNQDFAFDLYAELAAGAGNGNLLMAPYSVSVGLAMTYAGAAGETKSEMKDAGHLSVPEPALHAAFNWTARELEARSAPATNYLNKELPGARLSISNAAFARKATPFHDEYLDVLALNYDAGIYRLDFARDPMKARSSINDWVADQTEDRIQDLLPANAIDASSEIVLVDAVYFNANWSVPFEEEETKDATFHAPSGDVTVPMMHGPHENWSYAEGDGYQAVALPFVPQSLRMLFILPAEGRFDEIEAKLNRGLLADVQQTMSGAPVILSIPRFEFDSAFELSTSLEALGMQHVFQAGADFSRMTDKPLYISAVQHKTFISVNEQGVEAAAATAYVGSLGTGPIPPVMTLDRPFFFLIYDRPTNQILFLGRLEDPS